MGWRHERITLLITVCFEYSAFSRGCLYDTAGYDLHWSKSSSQFPFVALSGSTSHTALRAYPHRY